MELDWDEYISEIKIRRWDSEAGEYKYSLDINLQEDELGFITSVVGEHRSNRQIYELPDDCSALLQLIKRSEIEKVKTAIIEDCIGGDTHYIFSYHDIDGHKVDGNVKEGAVKNILDWVKQEYDWVPEIKKF